MPVQRHGVGSSWFQSEKAEPAEVWSTADFKERRERPSVVREWLSLVLIRQWTKRKSSVNERFLFIMVWFFWREEKWQTEDVFTEENIRRKERKGKESNGGRCGVVGSERFMGGRDLRKTRFWLKWGPLPPTERKREREGEEKRGCLFLMEEGEGGVEEKQGRVLSASRVWSHAWCWCFYSSIFFSFCL